MLDDVHLKCLDQLDASVDVYQHTGDQLHNFPPSQEIPLSRILQSDWLIAFWGITHEQGFSQIRELRWETKDYKHFYLALFPIKLNDIFFFFFWGGVTSCPNNSALSVFRYNYLKPHKKTNDQTLKKQVSKIHICINMYERMEWQELIQKSICLYVWPKRFARISLFT